MLAEIIPLGGIGKQLQGEKIKVPQILVEYPRVNRREDFEHVMPGRFVKWLEQAGIIRVHPVTYAPY
jgi:hypothetical protein